MVTHRRLYMQSLTWAYLASPCHWNVAQPRAKDRYWVRFPAGGLMWDGMADWLGTCDRSTGKAGSIPAPVSTSTF